jgi:hypothetical protein
MKTRRHYRAGAALTLNSKKMTPRDIKVAIQAFAKDTVCARASGLFLNVPGAPPETAFSLLNHGATLAVVGSPWIRSRYGST